MEPERRRFLRWSSIAAVGALAGCGGTSDSSSTATESSPTAASTDASATEAATEPGTTAGNETTERGAETTEDGTEGEPETTDEGNEQAGYTWMDATWDSYWYSLYNMSANISMSANGVLFPHNEEQRKAFEQRFPAMLQAANRQQPPVENANLNMAAFTDADPHFTQQPAFGFGNGGKRPNASTLA